MDLPTPPEVTFAALTDGELYSRWLQVPVSIDSNQFAATLEWGTEVRYRLTPTIPGRQGGHGSHRGHDQPARCDELGDPLLIGPPGAR